MAIHVSKTDGVIPKENNVCMYGRKGVETLTHEKGAVPTECGPYEAIVCPKRTGLCGSDMHIYLHGLTRGKMFTKPFILGHECAGIIAKVGEKVKDLKAGDRVALEPGEGCLRCDACKSGNYMHCEHMKFAAALEENGTLQGFYVLPADLCYKLPDNLSLEEGALIEPLAVGLNAVANIAKITPTSDVAVFGAGPVGLLTLACAKAFGARRLLAIDVNEERLQFAKEYLGCETHLAIPMEKGESTSDYSRRHAEHIKEKFGISIRGPNSLDYILDCSGAETCIQTAIGILKTQGTLVLVGNPRFDITCDLLQVSNRELIIKGCFRYGPGIYRMAIDLVQRGQINLKPLITHVYPFKEAETAFKVTKKARGPNGEMAIKVMIEGPEE